MKPHKKFIQSLVWIFDLSSAVIWAPWIFYHLHLCTISISQLNSKVRGHTHPSQVGGRTEMRRSVLWRIPSMCPQLPFHTPEELYCKSTSSSWIQHQHPRIADLVLLQSKIIFFFLEWSLVDTPSCYVLGCSETMRSLPCVYSGCSGFS